MTTQLLAARYGAIDEAYHERLATTAPDADGPIWMINLMKYRDRADYADRRVTTLSGVEADALYMPHESLAAVGAKVVFGAIVDTQFLGAPKWDRVGIVKYPSRRAFIDMQSRPEFIDKHVHKDAGMEHSIVIAGLPAVSPVVPADAPTWEQVPHPPTADDPYVVVLHVIRFSERGGATRMLSYQDEASKTALPHGVRISAWFNAEGTYIGDGRQWDQARFHAFPSRAAFMDVAADPNRLKAQKEHREVAIADTFTMILRPVIDRLQESLG